MEKLEPSELHKHVASEVPKLLKAIEKQHRSHTKEWIHADTTNGEVLRQCDGMYAHSPVDPKDRRVTLLFDPAKYDLDQLVSHLIAHPAAELPFRLPMDQLEMTMYLAQNRGRAYTSGKQITQVHRIPMGSKKEVYAKITSVWAARKGANTRLGDKLPEEHRKREIIFYDKEAYVVGKVDVGKNRLIKHNYDNHPLRDSLLKFLLAKNFLPGER